MNIFPQPVTHRSGVRVSGGIVLLSATAGLLGLGLVGSGKLQRA